MGAEVFISSSPVDIQEGTKIQFNYTIGDIFNIGYVVPSYSNAFKLPKTPNNTQVMEGLGLVGNNSQIPYQKTYATLKYDGFDIVPNGILKILKTEKEYYEVGITDSFLDFFKDIENKTIGNDVKGMQELKHDKDMNNFLTSITNSDYPYTYIVADFGGKMQLPDDTITIDYLIPVVKLSYIWNKIFETFGFTYSGSIFSNPDFTDACITYPKAPSGDVVPVLFSSAKKNSFRDENPIKNGNRYSFPDSYKWNTSGAGFYDPSNPSVKTWSFTVPESGTYRIKAKPIGYVRLNNNSGGFFPTVDRSYTLRIMKGTSLIVPVGSSTSSNFDFSMYDTDVFLTAGDIINFEIEIYSPFDTPIHLHIGSIDVEFHKTNLGTIDFVEAFEDFEIKDFVKEIINRYGLTPFYDSFKKHIKFLTIDEKINFNNYENWTNKYVQRQTESYLYGNYAQTNILAHKYNDNNDAFRNGKLKIDDVNLSTSKTIVSSKIHAAEQRVREYKMSGNVFSSTLYPLWQSEIVEVVENNQTNQKIEYKGLNGRYYIMKLQRVNQQGKFRSELLNSSIQTTPYYYVSNSNNTHYDELTAKYYPRYEKILNNFKMHEIELALSLPDILQLDFAKLYYFEQEASFYTLNKLTWEEGKTCKGEFIKINK